jgi:16S rRNA A1518/A1519 N6-dimethyltransferase RsmA/KsgA/DIM1 with predicted DNA glycosylase/AP lyase activity
MKVLFLVEDMQCVKTLESLAEIKIINEREIAADSPYADNHLKPGYSQYIVSRASNLAKIYNFKRPLALVLYQDHQTAVSNIPHDISVRIVHHLVPRRLINSPTYICDYTFIANELTETKLRDIFEI